MIRSSVKFIFRRLLKDKLYSTIKIAGLTIGMACMLLAILYIRDENIYDRFHQRADQLYRITTSVNNLQVNGNRIMGSTGQVQGPAFKAKIPEVEEYARIMTGLNTNFIGNEKPLLLDYLYADESFFKIFSFSFLYGNPLDALKELNSVVLTEQTALRFFGTADVVGKTIKLEEGHGMATFVITGVTKTIPDHSSIQFEAVLPFKYLQTMFPDNAWLNSYLNTFVLLNPRADVNKVKSEFDSIFQEEAGVQLKNAGMVAGQVHFGLQPITDIHLNIFEKGPAPVIGSGNLNESGLAAYSYLLLGIAAFILIMACVNFLNLSIADSLKRSKEIGVRKISGGTQSQIVRQFLTESFIVCGISYIVAIAIVAAILPIFNHLTQKHISVSLLSGGIFLLDGLMLISACTFIVGLYPAIKLSLFNAAEVLYNRAKLGGKNIFTKGLIVFQFTLAVGLLIATIIYYRQMNFIAQNDPGYDASGIIKIHLPVYRNPNRQVIDVLRNELNSQASVSLLANGDMVPGSGIDVNVNVSKITAQQSNVDPYFLPTLDIHLRQGRNFSYDFGRDSVQSVIVNETFVKEAGLNDPIGQDIVLTDGVGNKYPKTIVGMVKDFHYGSLREKIGPLVLVLGHSEFIWVKLQKGKATQALSVMEKIFKKTFPEYFYQYTFIEDENKGQYINEERWKQIISYAAALAMAICCIGLFGLTHFTTLKRRKEIGIRKVLGASAINISRLLSKNFLLLVAIAIIIAGPVAWYMMNNWLEGFSYRIQISWVDFMVASVIVLLIALITVSSQAFRAAMANPVKSLRTE